MGKPSTEDNESESRSWSEAEAIVTRYETSLLRYATRMLNDGTAAQDVVQEAFIRLFRRWTPTWPPDGRMASWLYRTTHNAAVDWIRREQRQRHLHERHAEQAALLDPPPEVGGEKPDRLQRVLNHLSRLDPSEREVLILRLQEGFSYRQIAQTTGRSIGTVGCLLHQATRKLTQSLKTERVLES
ncbi:MAG: sigma-70 family RNA polymerase sigma factor [Kiritimatiellia bacterium]|nr:sigma-70 family RNA polymerase sigma factor [Kiritimatiellia bacterium]